MPSVNVREAYARTGVRVGFVGPPYGAKKTGYWGDFGHFPRLNGNMPARAGAWAWHKRPLVPPGMVGSGVCMHGRAPGAMGAPRWYYSPAPDRPEEPRAENWHLRMETKIILS